MQEGCLSQSNLLSPQLLFHGLQAFAKAQSNFDKLEMGLIAACYLSDGDIDKVDEILQKYSYNYVSEGNQLRGYLEKSSTAIDEMVVIDYREYPGHMLIDLDRTNNEVFKLKRVLEALPYA